MQNSAFPISESLAYEQNLLALSGIADKALALAEIQPIMDRFILNLAPTDAAKAQRFEALSICRHFDANFEIAAGARRAIAQSGLRPHTQRPLEFAIGQFMASGAAQHWAATILRLTADARFSEGLQRPILFTVLDIADAPAGVEPVVTHREIPAFAHHFLRQEAQAFTGERRDAIELLARALELRLSQDARRQCAEETFMLAAFGELATSKAHAMACSLAARRPIARRK